jgi:hypothetical protein
MTAILGALLLLSSSATTTHAQVVIQEPDLASGSQLIFYYDAREGFTTYVNIRNSGGADQTVLLEVWSPNFETRLALDPFPLATGAVRVIDIGMLKTTAGMAAQNGIAVASVLDASGFPIHFAQALAGNFTVANLATGSAWGSPAAGRSAIQLSNQQPPANGTIVNGSLVIYQLIEPTSLALAAYSNPEFLSPVQDHGNQLLFVNFKDGVGAGSPLTAATTNWGMIVTRGPEGEILGAAVEVTGVVERDLVSILGTEVNGSSGGGGFDINSGGTENANRLIFFVQALGTFGTGYLLPHN